MNRLYSDAFSIVSLTMFGNFFADTYSPNALFSDENTVSAIHLDPYILKKYRSQIAWRRSKVIELLTRNYAQYEIANILHISQPTISRDIKYIQKQIKKTTENYGEHLFETYRNTLLGVDEALKKLWAIVDSPKTEAKEKVKAITLIKEYYKERLDLLQAEPGLVQHKKTMELAKLSQF